MFQCQLSLQVEQMQAHINVLDAMLQQTQKALTRVHQPAKSEASTQTFCPASEDGADSCGAAAVGQASRQELADDVGCKKMPWDAAVKTLFEDSPVRTDHGAFCMRHANEAWQHTPVPADGDSASAAAYTSTCSEEPSLITSLSKHFK